MSKRILSLVLALVMVLGTFGTVFAAEPTGNAKVDWLVERELVKGDEGGLRLKDQITRAEVATMLVRALDLEAVAEASKNFPSAFKDMNSPDVVWSRGHVTVAAAEGLIKGYEDGTFGPRKDITYAEVATMLVRVLGGLTEAEEKLAVGMNWATVYLTKAASLGIFDGVEVLDYSAKAERGTMFEMVYNAIVNKQIGNYEIVKAIVLENSRVEAIGKDEVVVEVIKQVQVANYADSSRKEKGDQERFVITEKVGDVEDMLGKVFDFTLDKDGKVVSAKLDTTYTYAQAPLHTINRTKVNGYTVELDERYRDQDERIFRTYHNDKAYSYADFDKDFASADFAKLTIKNGKVLFIDAFTFEDIAPVQEVRRDGLDVYVYNDYRDARVEKFEPRALVLGFNDGVFSRIERTDIKANDVVHVYSGNRMIVRTDAVVKGEYKKVERNRDNDYFAHVDDEAYLINDVDYRRPVFAHDSKAFTTLYAKDASQDLRDFYKEEVTVLLDINNDLQLFGAEVEWNEGMAIVKQVLARGQVKFVDAANEELILDEDYSSAISTHNLVNGLTTINQRLNSFNTQDLTFVLGDDTKIDTLVRIETAANMRRDAKTLLSGKAVDMNNSFIRLNDNFRYQVLDRTNVFAINANGAISASTVAKYQASLEADSTVKAFILSDADVYALANGANAVITDRNRITDKDNIAHTIVFIDLKTAGAKTDGETVLVDRVYTARTPHYVVGQRPDSTGKGSVERTAIASLSLRNMLPNDIVSLNLTKDDDKLVRGYDVLIAADKVKTDSYRVVGGDLNYSNSEYRRLYLVDAENDGKTNPVIIEKWLVRGVEEFGTITIDSVVTFHETNKTDKDIDVIRVYGKNTPVTANAGPTSVSGKVTYASTTRIELDGKDVYAMDADTRLVGQNGATLAIGGANIFTNANFVVGSTLVTVKNNVITITGTLAGTVAEREAVEAVEKAEDTLFDQDHNIATGKVNALSNGTLKTSLLDRLAAIEITAEVETVAEFNTELGKAWIQKIILKDNLTLSPVLNRSVKIDGNGKTLTGYILVNADDVTIENLTVKDSGNWGIQFYDVTGGKVNNVKVNNSTKGALLVNGSEVVVNGFTSIANPWGGIEVSKDTVSSIPKLVANAVTHDGVATPAIWIDGAIVNDGWVVAPGYTASPYTGGGKTQVWFVK